ncbi:hypothetical protein QTG56_24030 (plasmid) [Rossellomorea sp. AcN35-11]|nr:hypothetical protein [Rossellomorea aquimaris]WJV31708.1 hypothetical protein QTG56_24030 [Rossellomorea sp. AcN35-11]
MDKELIKEILAYVEETVEVIDSEHVSGGGDFEKLKVDNSGLIPEFYYTLKDKLNENP